MVPHPLSPRPPLWWMSSSLPLCHAESPAVDFPVSSSMQKKSRLLPPTYSLHSPLSYPVPHSCFTHCQGGLILPILTGLNPLCPVSSSSPSAPPCFFPESQTLQPVPNRPLLALQFPLNLRHSLLDSLHLLRGHTHNFYFLRSDTAFLTTLISPLPKQSTKSP